MTNLMTYQQAFEASAELVNTINTMLGDLMRTPNKANPVT